MNVAGDAPVASERARYRTEVASGRTVITGWVRSHPGLVILLALPVAVFGLPQLGGWTFLDGDNFLQNFPMRALVGHDLQHGVLPLWDPYLFSGTPLLGGFNAGAAYPTTWLMAVLPSFTAWTLNLALVYDVALAGMYVFLRRQSIGSTAATFGAATFAFSGYMTAQIVHIDLLAGAAWLPWMLVAVHALTGPRDLGSVPTDEPSRGRRHIRGWIALLSFAVGMSLLSGGIEAIIDGSILVAVYLIGRLATMGYFQRAHRGALVSSLATVALGAVGGVALGAAQWVPGLAFQSQSQRSGANYTFFTTGSLPARLVTLLATPFLLGTNHGWPGYAGPYNFQEVTSFVGILALIAAGSLLLRKWRRRPEARHWRVWYVVLAIGLLSALGGATPFGHALFLLPVVNGQRLLNRNLLLVDFSLAVLLAWWVHLLLEARGGAEPDQATRPLPLPLPLRRRWRPGHRAELVATCAPAAVIVGLGLFLWIDGPLLQRLLQIQFPVDSTARLQDAALVTVGAAIAVAATWVVLAEPRFSRARLRHLLAIILVADLVLFNAFVIHPPTPESLARGQGSLAGSLTSATGHGRFLIYDPDEFNDDQLFAVGQTDLNIFNKLASGQGYAALTDANYYNATGAHGQEDLNPATLAGSTWDTLNVRTLLSLPSYFVTPLYQSANGPAAAPGTSVPFPPTPNSYTGAPTPGPGPASIRPGRSHRWYFGGLLTVDHWTVRIRAGETSGLRVGVLGPTGATRWLPSADVAVTGSHAQPSLHVSLATPVQAGGLVIENRTQRPSVIGTPTARTAEAGDVALNGRMQYGVTWPHWKFTGTIGPFGVFQNADPQGWAWARGPAGTPPMPGTSVTAGAPGQDGGQRITVHATSATTLVRSVAWSPGWRATIRQGDQQPSEASVVQDGTVQAVSLPGAGDYVVTFTYAPGSATAGLAVSAVAALALALWAAYELTGVFRRRRRP